MSSQRYLNLEMVLYPNPPDINLIFSITVYPAVQTDTCHHSRPNGVSLAVKTDACHHCANTTLQLKIIHSSFLAALRHKSDHQGREASKKVHMYVEGLQSLAVFKYSTLTTASRPTIMLRAWIEFICLNLSRPIKARMVINPGPRFHDPALDDSITSRNTIVTGPPGSPLIHTHFLPI